MRQNVNGRVTVLENIQLALRFPGSLLACSCGKGFPEREIIMKVTHRAVTAIMSAAVVGMLLASAASACDIAAQPSVPFAMGQLMQDSRNPLELATSEGVARDATTGKGPSLVGMWSFKFISLGNTTRTPAIADGTQLNFGYTQYHSDETEILNSGARSPAQQNFCLGVWQKTGNDTYQVNHFALNFNATTGAWLGTIVVIEKVTVSPGGTALSGTFAQTVFDTTGTATDHVSGQITAQRVTVDQVTP
jgi:hypothetical protein